MKKKNRKKTLKLQLKRQGLLKTVQKAAEEAVETVVETAKQAVEKTKEVAVELTAGSEKVSLEAFGQLKELVDIRSNLVETLYNEGIHSVADFAKWTEKEILALKGIGPATVAKLKENGIQFKD